MFKFRRGLFDALFPSKGKISWLRQDSEHIRARVLIQVAVP